MGFGYDAAVKLAELCQMYEELECDLIKLAGCNLITLRELFAAGWTLHPPKESGSLSDMEE